MPVEDAQRILAADYRKSIRRGDLLDVAPGSVVAMIDGVFEQNLAVSLREINDAVSRGVVIYGGASMGALRAAEVPGVIGVGRIFEWYRDGLIIQDDEVALLFAEESGRALTVPTVNIRFAVDRLCRMGTIEPSTGRALISAALKIPYKERTHVSILTAAGVYGRPDSDDLIEMLQAHDLKYRDAQAVLEAVDRHIKDNESSCVRSTTVSSKGVFGRPQAASALPSTRSDEVLIWESGDRITHEDLVEFLAYTGQLEARVRSLHASLTGNESGHGFHHSAKEVQSVFHSVARRWGWMSSEETQVTLTDLGFDLEIVDHCCKEKAKLAELAISFVRDKPTDFRRVLLADLFLDNLALKREAMRLGGLRKLASQVTEEPSPEKLKDAETVLCKANGEFSFDAVRQRWARLGFANKSAQNVFVQLLARARHAGGNLVGTIGGHRKAAASRPRQTANFSCKPCPKPTGEPRFCVTMSEAETHARRIAKIIGVTRISLIADLSDLGGIQVAQAARPGNGWSSSYGSGKSRTAAGAIVGSVMEETEKWAQEQFRPDENLVVGSYDELHDSGQFIDPASLDLPYDSVYQIDQKLHWYPCLDLQSSHNLYVPLDMLEMRCRKHDICFTKRGARKHLATNGLGSGFSQEEAILHGLCEYVERHAQRLAEVLLSNPGGLGPHPYRFIDLSTASDAVQDVTQRLESRSARVRVLDITSEIRIPTFFATITRELQRADGWGTHPDPNIAIEMAILEAAQSIAGSTAGGREDLSVHARSLGRHERPRPVSIQDAWFWLDPDLVYAPLAEVTGFTSTDVGQDLGWCLGCLHAAGVERALVADLTPPGINPASVVRVILPGLETNNPFYTGPRARLLLLRDLLPRWL